MKKIDSSFLVCTAEQSAQLISLGILPASALCYESEAGVYEFAGEYIGQPNCIPAWTMEELHVLIGGDYPKPDLIPSANWRESINMMQYVLYMPKVSRYYVSGAQSAAAFLQALILDKHVNPADANARLQAFISKEHFNPMTENL